MWKKQRSLKLFIVAFIIAIAVASVMKYLDKGNLSSITIARSSVGGLSGRGDGKNLIVSNSQITYDGKVKPLSQEQLSLISEKLNKINFFSLKSEYLCSGCADQFTNKLSIKLGTKSNTVTFEDGSDAPTGLMGLDSYLQTLAP